MNNNDNNNKNLKGKKPFFNGILEGIILYREKCSSGWKGLCEGRGEVTSRGTAEFGFKAAVKL